ncbi:hypothetical protein ACTXT7_014468 [Hymenolepis weldensis]
MMTLATTTGVYICDRWPNGTWPEGIIRAQRGSVLYEVDVDDQTWMRHRNHLRSRYAAKLSKLERSSTFWKLRNSGNPTQQSDKPSFETFQETPKIFHVDPTFKNYDGKFSPGGGGLNGMLLSKKRN